MARQPAGPTGPSDDLKARAHAWVVRTCGEQGISPKLTDPLLIEKLAELFAQARKAGVKRDSSKRL